jgi:hypothetical protein
MTNKRLLPILLRADQHSRNVGQTIYRHETEIWNRIDNGA